MQTGAGKQDGVGEQITEPASPEPFDIDVLTRQQPSWRLHRAHPALGLLAAEEAGEFPGGDDEARDFGFKWLRLPAQEQRLRERDFMTGVLRHAARAGDARFRLSEDSGTTRDALCALPEVTWDEHEGCSGPLIDAAIDVLARRPCEWLEVACAGRPFLLEAGEHDGAARTDVLLWLDPWRSGDLRAELEAAWWPAAEARAAERGAGGEVAPRDGGRVSRERRAAILDAWERRGGWTAVKLAAVLVFTLLLSDTWHSALLVVAVALTIAFVIDSRLKRWHRRS
jgi:hypothetical protein